MTSRLPLPSLALSLAFALSLALAKAGPAWAGFEEPVNTAMVPSDQLPENLKAVAVERKAGGQIPLDLAFRDEQGRPVRLREIVRDRPTVLTLAYFKCPSLCSLGLTGLVEGLREIAPTLGKDYRVLTVSISPRETPRLALSKKRSYLARYARARVSDEEPGWRFLTGEEPAIRELARSVGFNYAYDARTGEYSHPSVAMVLTPEGRVSQYLFGIRHEPQALTRAIAEASRSSIGAPLAQVLLYCFHYDGATGRWTLKIMNVLRLMGVLTVIALCAGFAHHLRKERAA